MRTASPIFHGVQPAGGSQGGHLIVGKGEDIRSVLQIPQQHVLAVGFALGLVGDAKIGLAGVAGLPTPLLRRDRKNGLKIVFNFYSVGYYSISFRFFQPGAVDVGAPAAAPRRDCGSVQRP